MPDMLEAKGYLVVKANGEMRVTVRRPRLTLAEVAFPITVSIPRTWGRVQPVEIELVMPEPPEAFVTVDGAELALVGED